MSTHGDEPDGSSVAPTGTEPVTAIAPRANVTGSTTAGIQATVVTAEIPAVAPTGRASRSRTAATPYGPAPEPIEVVPAPTALRLVVWVLFFIFLIALIVLAAEHFHPDWLSFLRRSESTSSLGATALFS